MGVPRIRWSPVWMAVVLLFAICLASAAAGPQGAPAPAGATAIERGKTMYVERCAVCHGDRGRGNGPAASALRARPTNLTVLRKAHGTFPTDRVEASLKGTNPVVAHGIPGMMVWGALFLADANGNQAVADSRMRDVIAFIESIQAH